MDLRYDDDHERFRTEVQTFLSAHWPPPDRGDDTDRKAQERAFRLKAIEAGYLARSIPRRYGGSEQPADVLEAAIIREEFAKAWAPGDVAGLGPSLLVPTLLEKGAEWQKQRFVQPTIMGDIMWCQGYSEPNAGSDLANVQTRARLMGDEWVINGQKIWTSVAWLADYMFCLCRTEPEASKHAGISYLLIDMKQPGVDVRRLKAINGASHFCEVFLDDVRTPADWIVGERGQGWDVSRATLKHERNMIGGATQTLTYWDRLMRLAERTQKDGRRALDDPRVRDRLAVIEGYVRAQEFSAYRQLSKAAKGEKAGIVQSMNKINGTNTGHLIVKLALDLLGDEGLLEPEAFDPVTSPDVNTAWVARYMQTLGAAIAGGTSNIQRSVIAERGLGLPRDRERDQSRQARRPSQERRS
ncbi:MAG: acyl-CoA dehydrogenase family protein [Myxococcota bacterium]|jgi:alkylation response protein AidB-like acyl-CoA dehydrogenase|nr:acyl-CoA dehydrogenase family protein [Myxococcota bacterium]